MLHSLWIAISLLSVVAVFAQEPSRDEMLVIGEGMAAVGGDVAAAEEEAIWDAKRNAVEQAAGIFLRARSVGRDFQLVEDEIRTQTEGFIRRWEIVPGSRRVERVGEGQILRLKIRAVVALLPVIQRLSDIADVYEDLERPRVRIEMEGDLPSKRAQTRILAALKEHGIETSRSASAEIVLAGRLEVVPTVRLGEKNSPFGIGEVVAVCRARLTLQIISTTSEEILMTSQAEGVGQSFQSDADARAQACADAAENLLKENARLFVQHLLVRWARERQEGHTVVVQIAGLDARGRALLKEQIRAMRGFRDFLAESSEKNRYTLRFRTRLDTRGVRRRLAALRWDRSSLRMLNHRGPLILCAVNHPAARVP